MAGVADRVHEAPVEEAEPDGPVRLCALTRAERPIAELIRFAAAPDGTIVPDLAGKLPGRGVWITCDKGAVEKAAKGGAFAKSLKRQVKAAPDLADQVEKGLLARAQSALSIANKAGLVTSGFSQVEGVIVSGEATVLIHGSDAAAGGRAKLDTKFAAIRRARDMEATILAPLTIEQMSLAMGRANVVHAALKQGGATEKFVSEAGRLERFRSRTHSLPAGHPTHGFQE